MIHGDTECISVLHTITILFSVIITIPFCIGDDWGCLEDFKLVVVVVSLIIMFVMLF